MQMPGAPVDAAVQALKLPETLFSPRPAPDLPSPVHDEHDDVLRCTDPACGWEVHEGDCANCGQSYKWTPDASDERAYLLDPLAELRFTSKPLIHDELERRGFDLTRFEPRFDPEHGLVIQPEPHPELTPRLDDDEVWELALGDRLDFLQTEEDLDRFLEALLEEILQQVCSPSDVEPTEAAAGPNGSHLRYWATFPTEQGWFTRPGSIRELRDADIWQYATDEHQSDDASEVRSTDVEDQSWYQCSDMTRGSQCSNVTRSSQSEPTSISSAPEGNNFSSLPNEILWLIAIVGHQSFHPSLLSHSEACRMLALHQIASMHLQKVSHGAWPASDDL
jgi:hypothetical protein